MNQLSMIGRCILRLEPRTFFVKRSRRLKPQRLGSCLSTSFCRQAEDWQHRLQGRI